MLQLRGRPIPLRRRLPAALRSLWQTVLPWDICPPPTRKYIYSSSFPSLSIIYIISDISFFVFRSEVGTTSSTRRRRTISARTSDVILHFVPGTGTGNGSLLAQNALYSPPYIGQSKKKLSGQILFTNVKEGKLSTMWSLNETSGALSGMFLLCCTSGALLKNFRSI